MKLFKAVTILCAACMFGGCLNFLAHQILRNANFIVFRTQLEWAFRDIHVYSTEKKFGSKIYRRGLD